MAVQVVPGVGKIITTGGRRLYQDIKGRFTSRAKFELEQRRGPGGRFMSRASADRLRSIESYLRAELGAPPAGKNWATIASKYPERFMDYVADLV